MRTRSVERIVELGSTSRRSAGQLMPKKNQDEGHESVTGFRIGCIVDLWVSENDHYRTFGRDARCIRAGVRHNLIEWSSEGKMQVKHEARTRAES